MVQETVLVTGATSGIGREFARVFAAAGARLVIVGRDPGRLSAVAEELRSGGTEVHAIRADLSRSGAAEKVFEECGERGLSVDVLVNNAGSGFFGEAVDLDPAAVAESLYCNVVSLTVLCMLFGRGMKKRGRGAILNVASTAAYQPVPYLGAYAASKSYVLSFSEALGAELAEHGVQVTCISPGMVDTEWFRKAGVPREEKGFFALKKRRPPAEVARFGVRALRRGTRSCVFGFHDAVLTFLNRFLPRRVVASISKKMVSSSLTRG